MKAWNGGSVERALEFARKLRDKAVAQGASLCNECDGEGGTTHELCPICGGAGIIVPLGGLVITGEKP